MADNAPSPPETPLEPPQALSGVVDDATASPFPPDYPGSAGEPQGASGGLLQKIKDAPPWVWIGLALAGGTLIIGILAYRRQAVGLAGSQYQTGYNTTGLPASDATTGSTLDTSSQFTSFLQAQETQNGLLQQLLSKLGTQKPASSNTYNYYYNTPSGTTTKHPGPPLRGSPVHAPRASHPAMTPAMAVAPTAPTHNSSGPGRWVGTPVRAPGAGGIGGSFHWSV